MSLKRRGKRVLVYLHLRESKKGYLNDATVAGSMPESNPPPGLKKVSKT